MSLWVLPSAEGLGNAAWMHLLSLPAGPATWAALATRILLGIVPVKDRLIFFAILPDLHAARQQARMRKTIAAR
jgi:hypothetical protein